MIKLTLIGTGHLASALAKLYRCYYVNNAFSLSIMSHSTHKVGRSLSDTPIEEFDVYKLQASDIVVLAIPAAQTVAWAMEYAGFLHKKIVIDCSNKIGNGKKLHELLQHNECSVIKTFTAINVFHIMDAKFSITESSKQMLLAGNDEEALSTVSQLVARLGFIPKIIANIEASAAMEAANLSHFSKWRNPLISSTMLWFFYGTYAILERNLLQGRPWHAQSVQNINVAFACNALTQFGVVYSAGALAQIKQEVLGRPLSAMSDKYLVAALNRRKQLGLVAWFNLSIHSTISLLLFGSTYYEYFSQDNAGSTVLTDAAAISLLSGILGYASYSLISATSLPSIAKELGMREWRTVQAYLGWFALTLATTHVLAMSYQNLLTDTQSEHQVPSSFLLAVITPCLAIAAKVAGLLSSCLRKNKSSTVSNERSQPFLQGYNRYSTFGNSRPREPSSSSSLPCLDSDTVNGLDSLPTPTV